MSMFWVPVGWQQHHNTTIVSLWITWSNQPSPVHNNVQMFTIVSVTSKRLNFDIHWFSKYSYWMANHRPETLLSVSLCVTVTVFFSIAPFCTFSLMLDGWMDGWCHFYLLNFNNMNHIHASYHAYKKAEYE